MQLNLRIPAIVLTAAGATFLAYRLRGGIGSISNIANISSITNASNAASIAHLTTAPATNLSMSRGAVIALSHGGGPMPVLGDPASAELANSMRTRVPKVLGLNDPVRKPKAIVLVTAHWSESRPTISSGKRHKLLYDYGGFPPESYRLKYEAPGSPEVAQRVASLLKKAGFAPRLDDERGWDHGVFVPMLLVRPQADIPVVQLSVLHSEDPAEHFALGEALAPLRDEGIAIVGSGFASFHNLRFMFSGAAAEPSFKGKLDEWNEAVGQAVKVEKPLDRDAQFRTWRQWPAAYVTHPRGGAEHFLPLIVCAGAGGEGAGKSYLDHYVGLDIWSYYWD